MKKIVSALLVAAMLASSPVVLADPVAAVPPPAPSVSPLTKGQPAPYTGVLLSPEAVAQVVAQRDTAATALQLAVQHQIDLDTADAQYQADQLTTTCTADKGILQAQVNDQKNQVSILNAQLQKAGSGPSAPVWIGLGAVGGIVVSVLTVFAISRATK